MSRALYAAYVLVMSVVVGAQGAIGQSMADDCGNLQNGFGPYDYRTAEPSIREVVEKYHFTRRVESLQGGATAMNPGGDLNYTLKAIPNHHRALMALIRLSDKEKSPKPKEMEYSVACWFDRAERFQPDDSMVLVLHGTYLIRTGKPSDGAAKLEKALQLAGDNSNVYYNLGLAYFDLGDYEKALGNAHRAYALGFPLPGLRDKLKRAGKWQESATATKQ